MDGLGHPFTAATRRLRAGLTAPTEPGIQHLLDGLAGFYDSQADARAVMQQLGQLHGLQPRQLVLLGPGDAVWLRFVVLAWQWNRRPHAVGRPTVGPLVLSGWIGALAGLLVGLLVVDFDSIHGLELQLLALAAAVFTGAATAAGAVVLLHRQQPQFVDFDRTVRRKLGAGAWAVLMRDLHWSQQAVAVATVRQQGRHWCAVSSARRQR